jgi:hypothetical protein
MPLSPHWGASSDDEVYADDFDDFEDDLDDDGDDFDAEEEIDEGDDFDESAGGTADKTSKADDDEDDDFDDSELPDDVVPVDHPPPTYSTDDDQGDAEDFSDGFSEEGEGDAPDGDFDDE